MAQPSEVMAGSILLQSNSFSNGNPIGCPYLQQAINHLRVPATKLAGQYSQRFGDDSNQEQKNDNLYTQSPNFHLKVHLKDKLYSFHFVIIGNDQKRGINWHIDGKYHVV